MSDIVSQETRSRIMSSIRSKDTAPEMAVRSTLHRMGYRFRVHANDLPGIPDVILPRHKKIVFVHGCFWHKHFGCEKFVMPKNNRAFWKEKLAANVKRDKLTKVQLEKMGWKVLVVWECETKNEKYLRTILNDYMAK